MTPVPSIGRMVHYQSYGTPGGEYLPEPRAAIITAVHSGSDSEASVAHTGEVELHFLAVPRVSLAVLNPTGLHFNQGPNGEGIPYADTPTPGHWNWPPRV